MQNYIEKSTIEKTALSPSVTIGAIFGMAKGVFNKISGTGLQNTSNTHLFMNQSKVDTAAGYAFVPLDIALNATSFGSPLSLAWTPIALVADGLKKDDNGESFIALKAGYQTSLGLYS